MIVFPLLYPEVFEKFKVRKGTAGSPPCQQCTTPARASPPLPRHNHSLRPGRLQMDPPRGVLFHGPPGRARMSTGGTSRSGSHNGVVSLQARGRRFAHGLWPTSAPRPAGTLASSCAKARPVHWLTPPLPQQMKAKE
jgi:hypothetical protein